MKIALIMCPFGAMPPVGTGAVEKLFHLLAGEWEKLGHKVCFVCAGGGDNGVIEYRRIRRYGRTGSTLKDIVLDFFFSVKALLVCPKCDVLFCNTFWSPVLAPLMRWKYKRLVYGVHRFPKRQFFMYRFVHKFICVSTVVADALKRQVAEEKVCVIINPIDISVFNPVPRSAVKGRVCFAGRVHPLKGVACLAEACAKLYCEGLVTELQLIGPWQVEKGGGGEDFVNDLKVRAKDCPVVLSGAILDPVELAATERMAAVFVYPSEDIFGEACPVAPMEAMALGVPTIVSSLRCYEDYVRVGENAEKFECGNCEALGGKMRALLADPVLCGNLGTTASKSMLQYSGVMVAKKYLAAFEDMSIS